MDRRSADIATVISYPFGAWLGWFACHLGMPAWLAVTLAIPAGLLANVISSVLWRYEMRRRVDA